MEHVTTNKEDRSDYISIRTRPTQRLKESWNEINMVTSMLTTTLLKYTLRRRFAETHHLNATPLRYNLAWISEFRLSLNNSLIFGSTVAHLPRNNDDFQRHGSPSRKTP